MTASEVLAGNLFDVWSNQCAPSRHEHLRDHLVISTLSIFQESCKYHQRPSPLAGTDDRVARHDSEELMVEAPRDGSFENRLRQLAPKS